MEFLVWKLHSCATDLRDARPLQLLRTRHVTWLLPAYLFHYLLITVLRAFRFPRIPRLTLRQSEVLQSLFVAHGGKGTAQTYLDLIETEGLRVLDGLTLEQVAPRLSKFRNNLPNAVWKRLVAEEAGQEITANPSPNPLPNPLSPQSPGTCEVSRPREVSVSVPPSTPVRCENQPEPVPHLAKVSPTVVFAYDSNPLHMWRPAVSASRGIAEPDRQVDVAAQREPAVEAVSDGPFCADFPRPLPDERILAWFPKAASAGAELYTALPQFI